MVSGLVETISVSSPKTVGLISMPTFSSLTGCGNPRSLGTFLHVAWRAKQALFGAAEEVVETVEIDETDEARDERDLSDIMDSGLEPEEAVLIDGRRDGSWKASMPGSVPGYESMVHRLKEDRCAIAIAELIDGRLELQALTAGVLEATEEGVMFGVGRGPIRANAGVGGARSGLGSRKRGKRL